MEQYCTFSYDYKSAIEGTVDIDEQQVVMMLIYVTGFTKIVLIGTRNEIQFIADY